HASRLKTAHSSRAELTSAKPDNSLDRNLTAKRSLRPRLLQKLSLPAPDRSKLSSNLPAPLTVGALLFCPQKDASILEIPTRRTGFPESQALQPQHQTNSEGGHHGASRIGPTAAGGYG